MKKLLLYLTVLTLYGCPSISNPNLMSGASGECPEEPEVELNRKDVQEIELSNQMIIESGIAKKSKFIGFTFKAKEGQKIDYKTDDDICVWIYTPDNEIINSKKLPKTGKYIIQVSAPKGSQTFDLEMSLDTNESSPNPSTTVSERTSPEQFSQKTKSGLDINQFPQEISEKKLEKPSPEKAIENYYSKINNGNYKDAWEQLSITFQNNTTLHPNGYYSFIEWWSKVKYISIDNLRLIEKNPTTAIVDVNFKYIMKSLRESPQSLRLFLIWDNKNNLWKINKSKVIN